MQCSLRGGALWKEETSNNFIIALSLWLHEQFLACLFPLSLVSRLWQHITKAGRKFILSIPFDFALGNKKESEKNIFMAS